MPLPVTKSKKAKDLPGDNAPLTAGGAVGIVAALIGLLGGMPAWAVVVIIVAALAFTLYSQTHTERYDP